MPVNLFSAVEVSFNQLSDVLNMLSDEAYCKNLKTLSGSTIGQHTRHIIEMYECLLKEYETGIVCYDDRNRDLYIETNKEIAKEKIAKILSSFRNSNKEIELKISFGNHEEDQISITSNYFRELLYNLEHAVHHKALIKAGLIEIQVNDIPENFGVASSTIRHREQQCAQ